jgi:putative transposase
VNTGTALSVAQMCTLSGFSRAGYYRSLSPPPKYSQEDLKLRDAMHKVALDWPVYGSRRMARELKKLGWKVNRKRMQRLMREDNLLCLAKRKFVVTTDSAHPLPVYPNLPPAMEVTGINQLWIADITYIRLEEEFIYLAVILDAYSRRVIGWSLDDTIAESLTVAALKMALGERDVPPGLVHHSDRGVQYAAHGYTHLLKDHGIAISMSRKGNPWDNAACESFMKTLKHEEVNRTEYRNLADARTRIGRFLESIYNDRRMHSSLSYQSPSEFERGLAPELPKKEAA